MMAGDVNVPPQALHPVPVRQTRSAMRRDELVNRFTTAFRGHAPCQCACARVP